MIAHRLALVGCILSAAPAFAQSSATVGCMRGIVHDTATSEPAAGAVIVATSPSLVGEQTVITDERGQYFLTALPPGQYTLTIFHGGTFTRGNILVRVGKEAVVNLDVTSTAGATEVIAIEGDAPLVDQGSTKTGVTITSDFTRNIPTGRTFGDTLGAAAGAQQDALGTSFNGATSPENVFIIDGLDTTDVGFGGISTNLPNEFIDETEIVTGGYGAELGRAIGGVINVVTKQGSNRFRGSVFGYYQPGALVAAARPILRDGSSIDSKIDLDHRYDLGAEVGGPIVRDKLWFHAGINPTTRRTTLTRMIRSRRDDDQDGAPDIDPTSGFEVRDEVSRLTESQTLSTYFFTTKLTGAIDDNHFQIAASGNPQLGADYFGSVQRNPRDLTRGVQSGAYDVAAKWTSKFDNGKTQLDAVIGHHRAYSDLDPNSPVGRLPLVAFNYARSLHDFAAVEQGDLSACRDGEDDAYPRIVNCPVEGYVSQGTGLVVDEVRDRTQVVVAATHRFRALGYHDVKFGLDASFAGYAQTLGFSGGFAAIRRQPDTPAATGRWRIQEQFEYVRELAPDEDPMLADNQRRCAAGRAICERVDRIDNTASNRTYAAYVQDRWQPVPFLTVNAGLRWERQTGSIAHEQRGRISPEGAEFPANAYELSNLLAPRAGVIFDPTREGRAKLFAHWGRYFENVPLNLNVRAFGNGVFVVDEVNVRRLTSESGAFDPRCAADITNQPAGTDLAAVIAQCDDRRNLLMAGDALSTTTRGLEAQYSDEIVAGVEYEVIADLALGATYIRRRLPRVIEDVSIDSGNTYVITNPGESFDEEARELRAEAERARAAGNEPLAELLDHRADTFENIELLDKPVRNYDAIQLTVQQRPTRKSLLQASYTFSRLRGNFSGPLATDTGQLDPNITAVYDLPDLMANRYGAMALDRPHDVKLDGFYLFELGPRSRIVTGASFRARSGIADTATATHTRYGSAESFLLPRGTFGRSPTTSQTDIHVSYARQVGETMVVEGFLRVFNVLDQQAELDADDVYTRDAAMPIVGGDREDLRHLKALDVDGVERNRTVARHQNFGHLESRQQPRTIQLGVRLAF